MSLDYAALSLISSMRVEIAERPSVASNAAARKNCAVLVRKLYAGLRVQRLASLLLL